MAEMLAEDPLAGKCCVRGDGDSGDAHDDVWHSHVHQVHPSVCPEVWRSIKDLNDLEYIF